jgi:hypothetical protein
VNPAVARLDQGLAMIPTMELCSRPSRRSSWRSPEATGRPPSDRRSALAPRP